MKSVAADFLFLGTGGSMGVPVLGCECSVCTSTCTFDKRLRSSGLICANEKNLLIDCGPDFRNQALSANIKALDALILTHAHYDHVGGLDDLRAFFLSKGNSLPTFLSNETAIDIKRRFDYMFKKATSEKIVIPKFDLNEFKSDRGEIDVLGFKIKYLSYSQMGMTVNGIICGDLAYISDIKYYPETIFDDLKGVETLIISALRMMPSAMHFTVDEAIDFSRKVGAKKTYLTHIAHELDHKKTNAYLPPNIQMAYDGLNLTFHAELI